MAISLYSYWRSSAAYRIRIALELKGLEYDIAPVNLIKDGGEHKREPYKAINPQGLVPTLLDGEIVLGQSPAILEYLEDIYPEPALLPANAHKRALVRQVMYIVCCDIHPLNNVRVVNYLSSTYGVTEAQRKTWMSTWMDSGFAAIESLISQTDGPYTMGDVVSLADVCLIPQVYNANRFDIPLEPYPRIRNAVSHCLSLESFQKAAPEHQPDAVSN